MKREQNISKSLNQLNQSFKKKVFIFFKTNGVFFLMLLPGVVVLLINKYLPMAGIVVAFKDYNYGKGIFGSPWVGFKNFEYLFMSGKAWTITRNTLLYNTVFILVSVTVPVMIAIALKELLNKRGAKIYQSIFFLPYFLSWVVVSYLVFGLLSADTRSFNVFLKSLGLETKNWYAQPKYWPFFLTMINSWKTVGYDIVVFMASICSFDKTYYEVATVEGASKWQQIKSITFPLLKPIIITLTLMKVGRIFFADFGLFYIIPRDSGVLNNVVDVIDTYVYRGLRLNGDIGMATAAGLFQSVVGFVTIISANYLVKKFDEENSLF